MFDHLMVWKKRAAGLAGAGLCLVATLRATCLAWDKPEYNLELFCCHPESHPPSPGLVRSRHGISLSQATKMGRLSPRRSSDAPNPFKQFARSCCGLQRTPPRGSVATTAAATPRQPREVDAATTATLQEATAAA